MPMKNLLWLQVTNTSQPPILLTWLRIYSQIRVSESRNHPASKILSETAGINEILFLLGAIEGIRKKCDVCSHGRSLRCPFKARKVGPNVRLLVSKRRRPREVLWKNVHVGPAHGKIKQSWSAADERAVPLILWDYVNVHYVF
jgi:hypothetical protein